MASIKIKWASLEHLANPHNGFQNQMISFSVATSNWFLFYCCFTITESAKGMRNL